MGRFTVQDSIRVINAIREVGIGLFHACNEGRVGPIGFDVVVADDDVGVWHRRGRD